MKQSSRFNIRGALIIKLRSKNNNKYWYDDILKGYNVKKLYDLYLTNCYRYSKMLEYTV